MKIGVPREIKTDEHRVSLTPAAVRELSEHGHEVLIESGAGVDSGMPDDEYVAQGGHVVADAETVFDEAQLIVKVKEPLSEEVARLSSRHVLFTFLHLAPAPELTDGLRASGAVCIAYETVEDEDRRLPLLAPMSEIAGRLASQAGAFMLEKQYGGRGVLLGGVPGVAAANVIVIGGGNVGVNAARIAIGLGADVFVLDLSIDRLRQLEVELMGRCSTVHSSTLAIERLLPTADLVIGAVLVPGDRAPKVIKRAQLALMTPGAVLVDVAIDQGGCFETSRPTTHRDPTYEVDGITHYCVTNMPGAVPVTASQALSNATLPYVTEIADLGVREAVARNAALRRGVNVAGGRITHPAVARAMNVECTPVEAALQEVLT